MINFIKRNWIWFVVIIVLLFGQRLLSNIFGFSTPTFSNSSSFKSLSSPTTKLSISPRNTSSTEMASDRMVIENTNLSLRVDDVDKSIASIKNTAKELGGFLVNSSVNKPEESANGYITVRIPDEKKDQALDTFKKIGNKVVSENVLSHDITEEYQDIAASLEVLTKTKIKYEEILNKAEEIDDILNVQQKLTSLQSQIDNLKGQQKYYEQSVNLTKITIYLSTDEISLPYAPSNSWQPKAIFKQAIRSLVQTFRGIGSLFIWALVYVPIILPTYAIIRIIKKRKLLKTQKI